MLGPELGEHGDERAVGSDPRERVSLQPIAGIEKARGDTPRRRRGAARRKARLRFFGEVELVRRVPDGVLSLRGVLEAREYFAYSNERLLAVGGAVDLEADSVAEIAFRTAEPLLESFGEVGRIEPGGKCDDADVESLRGRELHAPQRRRLAGGVAVEAEPHARRQPPELLQLSLGQRGSHRGDHWLDPSLAQREHVRVPLDDHRSLLLRDRGARPVESVQEVAFPKELALGRVHILCAQRIVLAQLPRLEAEHASACIGEREEQPAGEVIVAAPIDESCGEELVAREAAIERLARERRPSEGESETVLATDLLGEASPFELVPRERARLRIPEISLVERRGRVEHLEQTLPPPAARVLLRRRLLVLDLDVEPIREPFDRAREVELLGLANERDQVALRTTAEAVVELVDHVDREARRSLLVERTAAEVPRPGLTELSPRGNDRDHVGRRLDLVNGGVFDPCH